MNIRISKTSKFKTMKRFLKIAFIICVAMTANRLEAQKFALIDMDYVMKNIPSYETANEQLTLLSKKWQSEVETLFKEAETMARNYQTELVFLSDDMKAKREEAILAKEKEATELKRKYFGPQGELFSKRESLIKPIQEEIYNAVQEICNEKFYQMVIDKSSNPSIVFAAPKIDISDDVLQKLGYSK